MGTEIEDQHILITQSKDENDIKSSSSDGFRGLAVATAMTDENSEVCSETPDTTNGIKDHEKLVGDSFEQGLHDTSTQSIPVVRDSQHDSNDPSNGQIDTPLDSDSGKEASTHDTEKDSKVSDDAAINGKAVQVDADESGNVTSTSSPTSDYDLNRIHIDTTAPFESVKEAVSKFGGIVDWKAHKVQTVERRKIIEEELEKVQQEIPLYKEQSEVAEQSKIQLLKELEATKRLIEDLKLNLERVQTEERQAKQDSELAKLRVEEMEQGIAHEASVAAKTQLEVAKSRHEAAISDLKTVKDDLEKLRREYGVLLSEKDEAEKKAEEAVLKSKEVEKTVEELTIELISTKESLEFAHAAHLEAEEHRIGASMVKEQDVLSWDKELKQAEEDLGNLNMRIEYAKELKGKLNAASSLLADLKSELASYMELKISQEANVAPGDKTHAEIQSAVSATNKELEEVKLNIEKATDEVNCLKQAATSLKTELDKEKIELANLRQREGMASIAVASLEAELERIKSEISEVQSKEKAARERMMELPKQLQHASKEADKAKSVVELAREELRKAKEEAAHAKAGANTVETRLLAARKEIEAARASERLALAAIKALQETNDNENNNDNDNNGPSGVALSFEEYYGLSKRAYDAEEEANKKVGAAMSQIEVAKESESRSLAQLEEANIEIEERKEALRIAMEKAEKAKEGKLGVEQELRKWRADNEQRRKSGGQNLYSPRKSIEGAKILEQASDSSIFAQGIKIEKVVDPSAPSIPYDQGVGLKSLEQIANPSGIGQQSTSPKSFSEESVNSPKSGQSHTMKKKKRSLFPRFFMFLARRKSTSKTT